jgi:hypothetical protein
MTQALIFWLASMFTYFAAGYVLFKALRHNFSLIAILALILLIIDFTILLIPIIYSPSFYEEFRGLTFYTNSLNYLLILEFLRILAIFIIAGEYLAYNRNKGVGR